MFTLSEKLRIGFVDVQSFKPPHANYMVKMICMTSRINHSLEDAQHNHERYMYLNSLQLQHSSRNFYLDSRGNPITFKKATKTQAREYRDKMIRSQRG